MKVKLENVRIGFPRLFTAEQYNGKGAFNYSAKFFIVPGSKSDVAIREAINTVAQEKWPKRYEAMLEEFRPDKKAYPFIDGKRVEFDGAEGHWILTAKRKQDNGRPTVVDERAQNLDEHEGRPYAGCYVNAHVEFWAQDGDAKGIRCTLRGVQFAGHGEAFGGSRPASEDEFDVLAQESEEALV
mgnify:CR=1 FL=1